MSLASAKHRLRTRSPSSILLESNVLLPIPPTPFPDVASADTTLRNALTSLAAAEPDYWSFRGRAARDAGHGLFQYPAMMVPQMLGALLEAILKANPRAIDKLDEFDRHAALGRGLAIAGIAVEIPGCVALVVEAVDMARDPYSEPRLAVLISAGAALLLGSAFSVAGEYVTESSFSSLTDAVNIFNDGR